MARAEIPIYQRKQQFLLAEFGLGCRIKGTLRTVAQCSLNGFINEFVARFEVTVEPAVGQPSFLHQIGYSNRVHANLSESPCGHPHDA